MPLFQYRVRDRNGKVISSSIEADSIAQVRDALWQRNLFIVDIRPPARGLRADIKIPGLDSGKPGLKNLSIFSRQMATMVNAGVPLVQSLAVMQRQVDHSGLANILKDVRGQVESGQSFSEALAKHPKVFNRLYLNLVRAGEASGNLDSVLDRISTFLEKELALRGKIRSAMTYPVIVFVFAIAITYFLLTTIVPQFANILTQLGASLPALTLGLIAVSNFLRHELLLLVLIIAALVVAYTLYYRTPQGRHVIDAFKLRIPLFGSLLKRTAIATFARTFSLLLTSGVNVIESLDITRGSANNAIVEETIENTKYAVMGGDQMSNSLVSSKLFPPMVISMIAIGEETGALDAMLAKVADFYEREVDEAVEGLTAAIEPIMIIFLGVVVGLIVAGMFLPMFAIIGQLSKGG
jgi:type IV pilus assembly protein PilC